MRIVAGRFRGHRLAALGKGDEAARLRPTSDRARESLFNIIQSRHGSLDGAHVLDLFAGTGALGLEALSRGAQHVSFVENGAVALRLLRENTAKLKLDETASVLRLDATRLGACDAAVDVVFADPPYGKGLGVRALHRACAQGWFHPETLVVLEEGSEVAPPEGLVWHDIRQIGAAMLHLGGLGTNTR